MTRHLVITDLSHNQATYQAGKVIDSEAIGLTAEQVAELARIGCLGEAIPPEPPPKQKKSDPDPAK